MIIPEDLSAEDIYPNLKELTDDQVQAIITQIKED